VVGGGGGGGGGYIFLILKIPVATFYRSNKLSWKMQKINNLNM
jgi:hypothetical protein